MEQEWGAMEQEWRAKLKQCNKNRSYVKVFYNKTTVCTI